MVIRPTNIGGTKNPKIDLIKSLEPHLIIANKEENRREDIQELADLFPTYLSAIEQPSDMVTMMLEIGLLCHKTSGAKQLVDAFYEQWNGLSSDPCFQRAVDVCYLIWRNPYMTVGRDTYIHSILHHFGFNNVFSHELRYPSISISDIAIKKPNCILLPSEPFPFNHQHIDEFAGIPCELVDGRMFSWYGSFMLKSFSYLEALKRKILFQYEENSLHH